MDSRTKRQKSEAEAKAEFQQLIGANWIWSPAHEKDKVPEGECYFRKTIMTGGEVEFAEIHAACDNQYELFVNGQAAGNWRRLAEDGRSRRDQAHAAGRERRGHQGDECRRRRGRHRGSRDRQGTRRHVRKLLDGRVVAHERQGSAELESPRVSAIAPGWRPKSTVRSAACCRGATKW